MKEALLLVFANKQDIQGGEWDWLHTFFVNSGVGTKLLTARVHAAMTPQEVQERLKLNQLKDKIWYVVPSCATTGEGLFEGLVSTMILYMHIGRFAKNDQGWLSNNVKTPPQRQAR